MSRLVRRGPDVHQGHGGVEPIEDADGEGHVTEYCPQIRSIEIYLDSLVVVAPDKEGLHDVDCEVGHYQEGDNIAALHLSLSRGAVGTSPQSIYDHRSLYQNLHQDQQVSEEESCLKLSI